MTIEEVRNPEEYAQAMEKKKRDCNGLIIIGVGYALLILGIIVGAYLISISDLPEWFKFWLLK